MCMLSSFSQFMKEMEKWDFWTAYAGHFSNSLESFKVAIFEFPLPSYFVRAGCLYFPSMLLA